MRLSEADLSHHFNGCPQNIGVLLGEPSGWLVDVDLDHPRCVELADQFLPSTPAIFGRPGKPRSHRIYRVTGPVDTVQIKSKSAGTLVELRSTGTQTIFPPSTHTSGELIRWETTDPEPAQVDAALLLDGVLRLASKVRVELGERPARSRAKLNPSVLTTAHLASSLSFTPLDPEEKKRRCLAAMLRIGVTDQHDGSRRLFVAACRAIEHDLDQAQSLAVLQSLIRQKPFPRNWSDDDIIRRLRDAEKQCERGKALVAEPDGSVRLGNRDPQTGKLVLSAKRTVPTAEAFTRDFYAHPDATTLVSYAGLLLEWRNNRYEEVEEQAIRRRMQLWLHDSLRYHPSRYSRQPELGPFDSNPSTVTAALTTLKDHVHIPATTASPSWLRQHDTDPSAVDLLPCRSLLLHLPTGEVLSPTPAFFSLSALDFDPQADAPPPAAWFAFLHQLFDGDTEAIDLLQEWFGYCLTGDTSQQKMLLIVGPKRSGKGTVARVLTGLIGAGNICGPTTSSLAGNFGLQPLIGKTLAIVSDARFGGENVATVVERLLCISGEDALTIDRKHQGSVTMRLPTRFMFLTNELPRLSDASCALAGRFVVLKLTRSFYGQEDTALTNRLLEELPGILNWSIQGWANLRTRGHFLVPASAADVVEEIQDLSSPVSAFIRDECVVGPAYRIAVDNLYEAWKGWCGREGRQAISTRQTFGKDLAAAIPGLARRRGTAQQPFYEGVALKGASSQWDA